MLSQMQAYAKKEDRPDAEEIKEKILNITEANMNTIQLRSMRGKSIAAVIMKVIEYCEYSKRHVAEGKNVSGLTADIEQLKTLGEQAKAAGLMNEILIPRLPKPARRNATTNKLS